MIGIAAPDFANLDADLQALLQASSISIDTIQPALSGAALYNALPPKLKACVLNLFLKSSNTKLFDGTNCFGPVHSLVEIDQDRFFGKVDAALLEEAADSPSFH